MNTSAAQVDSGSDAALQLSVEAGIRPAAPCDLVKYDAFISYSHAVDRRLAAAIQSGVAAVAKRLECGRSLRLFHDETCLSADADLWPSIESALHNFGLVRAVLLTRSRRVAVGEQGDRDVGRAQARRADRSRAHRRRDCVGRRRARLHRTLDRGSLRALRGRYLEAPHYIDLRWAHAETSLDLRNASFRAALAILAARIDSMALIQA